MPALVTATNHYLKKHISHQNLSDAECYMSFSSPDSNCFFLTQICPFKAWRIQVTMSAYQPCTNSRWNGDLEVTKNAGYMMILSLTCNDEDIEAYWTCPNKNYADWCY